GRTAIDKTSASSIDSIVRLLLSELSRILKISTDRIDINRAIVDYGIDSLKAIELIHGIEASLSVALPLATVFQQASIAEIAAQVFNQSAGGSLSQPVTQPERSASRDHDLSLGQQALWIIQQLEPDNSAYYIPACARILGELNQAAFRKAFELLVQRHPTLRTTFPAADGMPRQCIQD